MCLYCAYAQVWLLVANWTAGQVKIPVSGYSMQEWWNSSLRGLDKKNMERVASLLIYTSWNIWKERNRRIF